MEITSNIKHIQLIQSSLTDSMKELLDATNKVYGYCEILARLREEYVKSKILGREFPTKDLFSGYKSWVANKVDMKSSMRAIGVKAMVSTKELVNKIKYNDNDGSLIILEVWFLRNPKELLKSPKNCTDCEKKLLTKMQEYYDSYPWKNDYKTLLRLNSELSQLKHGYYIADSFEWHWNISSILNSYFIEKGLRCGSAILINT